MKKMLQMCLASVITIIVVYAINLALIAGVDRESFMLKQAKELFLGNPKNCYIIKTIQTNDYIFALCEYRSEVQSFLGIVSAQESAIYPGLKQRGRTHSDGETVSLIANVNGRNHTDGTYVVVAAINRQENAQSFSFSAAGEFHKEFPIVLLEPNESYIDVFEPINDLEAVGLERTRE